MTQHDDLDAGLDTGLETYPRAQIVLLAAAPWIAQLDSPLGVAIALAWATWSGRRRTTRTTTIGDRP